MGGVIFGAIAFGAVLAEVGYGNIGNAIEKGTVIFALLAFAGAFISSKEE